MTGRRLFAAWAAIAVAISMVTLTPPALANDSGIFRDSLRTQARPGEIKNPEQYVRSRLVHLNERDFLRLLDLYQKQPSSTLQFNFFEDATYFANQIQKILNKNSTMDFYFYAGHVKGDGEMQVIPADSDINIYVDTPSGSFIARKIEGDLYLVAETPPFDRSIPDHDSDPKELPLYPQDMFDRYPPRPRE